MNVEIKLPANPLASTLEKRLQEELGLQQAIVVPASVSESTDETEDALIRDVASVAAVHLPKMLENAKVIGLGWGRTLYSVPAHLPFMPPDPSKIFVPLVSNLSLRNRFLQTSNIVSRYGERFDSETYYLNISAVKAPNEPRTESEILNIRQLEQYWDSLDVALISLGAPPLENTQYLQTMIAPDMFSARDVDPDARGEMLSQTYFSDGTFCPIGRNIEVVAFPLDRLRDVPSVICLAAGTYKAEPLLYAARNGFFKTLITDHLTAQEILRLLKK